MKRQIEALQRRVEELEGRRGEAGPAVKRRADYTPPPAAPITPPPPTPVPAKTAIPPPIKISLEGSFATGDTVWRQRNIVADISTPFGSIPFPFSPFYDEHEFHGSARVSRFDISVEGNIDRWQKLTGYWESDFIGLGGGPPAFSTYTETNSWLPRLRQAYASYDNSSWGFHFLAGQAFSLLTAHKVGITPRQEDGPETIEFTGAVGFNYTRQWQLHAVQELAPGVAFGVSVENPATNVGASTATAPGGTGGAFTSGDIVGGVEVNFDNTGNGGILNNVAVTTDQVPDVIEKVAFDPGWGHYEIFALERFFTDHILSCIPSPCVAGSSNQTGTTATNTKFGGGIGGSLLLPLLPRYLELHGSVLYGRGVGRYAAGQLPDVTIAADGSLTPLTGLSSLVGLTAHPWEGLDVYTYAGIEQVAGSYFNVGTTLFGYGNPGFSNVGCTVVTPFSFALNVGGTAPSNCIGNNRRLSELTAGFWQTVYKGNYGSVFVGAQYEYVKREVFAGLGGAPSTNDNIFLTSVRYFPFEMSQTVNRIP